MLEPKDLLVFAGTLITAIIAVSGVLYTQRTSKRLQAETVRAAAQNQTKQLEAEAYARARESYEASIKRYQADVRRLTARVTHAEMVARHAERRIDLLEDILRSEGIPIPPSEQIPGDAP